MQLPTDFAFALILTNGLTPPRAAKLPRHLHRPATLIRPYSRRPIRHCFAGFDRRDDNFVAEKILSRRPAADPAGARKWHSPLGRTNSESNLLL